MNNVCLAGRLAAEPEVRHTQGEDGYAIATFTLAVNRDYVNRRDPNAQTVDFIRCQAFRKDADFIENYFHKGSRLAVVGKIQTGSYTNKEGQKVYTTDVVVTHAEFCENKGDGGGQASAPAKAAAPTRDTFMNVPADSEDDLPFN